MRSCSYSLCMHGTSPGAPPVALQQAPPGATPVTLILELHGRTCSPGAPPVTLRAARQNLLSRSPTLRAALCILGRPSFKKTTATLVYVKTLARCARRVGSCCCNHKYTLLQCYPLLFHVSSQRSPAYSQKRSGSVPVS